METPQFQKTDQQSFFGEYLYDQIVPKDHFLRKLRELHIPAKSHTHSGNMPHTLGKKYWLK
jgi:hypothetical protein